MKWFSSSECPVCSAAFPPPLSPLRLCRWCPSLGSRPGAVTFSLVTPFVLQSPLLAAVGSVSGTCCLSLAGAGGLAKAGRQLPKATLCCQQSHSTLAAGGVQADALLRVTRKGQLAGGTRNSPATASVCLQLEQFPWKGNLPLLFKLQHCAVTGKPP